jgi:flagellar biosynthesis protein FlhB
MSDEARHHEPTPRRIEAFRARGDLARSPELCAAAVVLGAGIGLVARAPAALAGIDDLFRHSLRAAASGQADPELGRAAATVFVGATAPVAAGALLGYGLAALLQLGWPPVLQRPSFAPGRLWRSGALSRFLSPRLLAGRACAAALALAAAGAAVLSAARAVNTRAPALTPDGLAAQLAAGALEVGLRGAGALALIGLVAHGWRWRELRRRMRMTPAELRREQREQEGDPRLRAERRRRVRALIRRAALAAPVAAAGEAAGRPVALPGAAAGALDEAGPGRPA